MIEESQELIGTISTEDDLHGQISPPNGTDDYTYLKNKPKINNVLLNGNISLDDIGAVPKETGKGLSSNDFTNTYKDDVDSNTENRHTHTNKSILDNITADDISSWNNKSDFSGDYDDLDNKPTIPNITQQQIFNIDRNTDMLNGETAMGNIIVEDIKSRNLLNDKEIIEIGSNVNYSSKPNHAIVLNWLNGSSAYIVFNKIKKTKDTYTIHYTNNGNGRFFIRPFDSTDTIITNLSLTGYTYNGLYKGYYKDISGTTTTETFTLPSSVDSFAIGIVNVNENTWGYYYNIQVEEGAEATDYVEYLNYNNNVYSENETVIGEYDGKTLYRKILKITPTAQYTTYNHYISGGLGRLIHGYGYYVRTNTALRNQIPATYTGWEVWLYDFTITGFSLRFSDNVWNNGIDELQITLEYTKNID